MLTYVFWHWPSAGVPQAVYRNALLAFHGALSRDPPPGLRGSRISIVAGAPWLPVREAYEDRYVVDDYAALGALNDAATSGPRQSPHRDIANLTAAGLGALYGLFSEGRAAADEVTWVSKPRGMTYAEFRSRLPPGPEVWRRQLVLGPAPEFLVAEAVDVPGAESLVLTAERLHG